MKKPTDKEFKLLKSGEDCHKLEEYLTTPETDTKGVEI
jgi:hypothetical protein